MILIESIQSARKSSGFTGKVTKSISGNVAAVLPGNSRSRPLTRPAAGPRGCPRWRRPDWLTESSADVVHAREVPAGYGHYYGLAIVDAWTAVAGPDGWDDDDTDALREIIARHHAL